MEKILDIRSQLIQDKEAPVTTCNQVLGSIEVVRFPNEPNLDIALTCQIRAFVGRSTSPLVSSVTQAWQAVPMCDSAKVSSKLLGAAVNAHELLEACCAH